MRKAKPKAATKKKTTKKRRRLTDEQKQARLFKRVERQARLFLSHALPLKGKMCEVCKERPAKHRDHKVPVFLAPELIVCLENVQLICVICHNSKTVADMEFYRRFLYENLPTPDLSSGNYIEQYRQFLYTKSQMILRAWMNKKEIGL